MSEKDSITVLSDLNFVIEKSTWTSLVGASGSGKSTLLTLLAGLDVPTSGDVRIEGQSLSSLNEDDRSDFRAQHMGFIFQNFRLLPHLTALENVVIPLEILNKERAKEKAREMLERVGLGSRLNNLPSQLSGGEQQRVAVARAFISQPRILFADEPTGNLDSKNGAAILDIMKELHEEYKSTLIVVTHDPHVSSLGQRQLFLKDGKLVEGL
ncbi:MAG: ABC transporter ATP-binding protein [Bdellovibrionota bacterium]